jgi:hypothetical protein
MSRALFRRSKNRVESRKQTFELVQADLETLTEMLSGELRELIFCLHPC